MNVLSLFDGISCGQIALNNLNIKIDNYYASEVDKNSIFITQKNFPNTIQLGDVTKLHGNNLSNIDLLIGGSPCQGFSFSGKQLNFEDPRSKLFFEFVRLLKKIKPTYFLLENVKMKKEYKDIISDYLGVEPILINSNIKTPQNRPRLYWTNIPGVNQPKDKNISLDSIIEKNIIKKDNSFLIDEKYWKNTKIEDFINTIDKTKPFTPVAFTERRTEEAKKIRREYKIKYGKDFSPRRAKEMVPRTDGNMNCLTATYSIKEHSILDENFNYRKLTPIECERLQGVPDNYTKGVSIPQRYKILGNGWTVDIIMSIFENLLTLNSF